MFIWREYEKNKMIAQILIENGIFPQPMVWQELYKLICNALTEKNIPQPLILARWYFSSDVEKSNRFMEHLKLIDFDSENRINSSLWNIKEKDWYKKKV